MQPVTANANNRLPSLVIAIPIYKREFDLEEQTLVDRMFAIFINREMVFVAPKNLENAYYLGRYPDAKLITFPDHFFESVQGYSRLLLSRLFYETFCEKDFLLISQPDVYVFRDDLNLWLQKPYDYIGAPWPRGFSININIGRFANISGGTVLTTFVGNGGFSLRKITKCLGMLDQDREVAQWFSATGSNEDLFFSLIGSMTAGIVFPNPVEASLFAMEVLPEYFNSLNGRVTPMAAHAFRKHSPEFWESRIDLHAKFWHDIEPDQP
jgi:hypothetical protein